MTHEVTVYDIFLRIGIRYNTHLGFYIRTVKCHPKFYLVERVLSQGGGVVIHPAPDTQLSSFSTRLDSVLG